MTEEIFEVYWEGPFDPTDVEKLDDTDDKNFVLYSVYGSHPLYGKNVLLYIGKTTRGVKKRLAEHDYWMDEGRFGDSQIYLASLGKFISWDASEEIERFTQPDDDLIQRVESLLIYAHQPVYNKKSRESAVRCDGLRLFNTGNFGHLQPEISALYHIS